MLFCWDVGRDGLLLVSRQLCVVVRVLGITEVLFIEIEFGVEVEVIDEHSVVIGLLVVLDQELHVSQPSADLAVILQQDHLLPFHIPLW